jgi:hypothetical protein
MPTKNGKKKQARRKSSRTTATLSVSMLPTLLSEMDERCQEHVPPLNRSQYLTGLIINDLKAHGYIANCK